MRKAIVAVLVLLSLLCGCATQAVEQVPPVETQVETGTSIDGKLKIRFFNVEGVDQWGDSAFIQFPNGQTMMIDYGTSDAGFQVAAALKAMGITHVDYAVFSHCHSDHANGFTALQAAGITFSKAITSGYYTLNYAWLRGNFITNKIEEMNLTAGDSFDVGDVHFDVLWPVKERLDFKTAAETENHSGGTDIASNDDMNSTSLVLKMTYGSFSVLFTGDIYQHAEADIIELYKDTPGILDCDVIKTPHHGKTTSSSVDFINAVSAKAGIVSGTVPMNVSVFKSYCMAGGIVYHTCQNGNIYIESGGTGFELTADVPELTKTFAAVVKMVNGEN